MATDGTCPTCLQRVTIDNTTFRLRPHKADGRKCPGGGQLPRGRGRTARTSTRRPGGG